MRSASKNGKAFNSLLKKVLPDLVWVNDIPMRSRVWQEAVTLPPLGTVFSAPNGRRPSGKFPRQLGQCPHSFSEEIQWAPRSFGKVRSGSCHTHASTGGPIRKLEESLFFVSHRWQPTSFPDRESFSPYLLTLLEPLPLAQQEPLAE